MIAILSPGQQGIHHPQIHDTLTIGGPDGVRFLDFRRKLLAGDPEIRGIAAHATTDHPEMQGLLYALRPYLYTTQLLSGYRAALFPLLMEPEAWTLEQRSRIKIMTDLMLTACLLEDVPDYRQLLKLPTKASSQLAIHQGSNAPLAHRVMDALSAHEVAQRSAPGNAPLERMLQEFSQQHPSF